MRDANNNLAYKTDRNGNSIIYAYDYQNRLSYKEDPSFVSYNYDAAVLFLRGKLWMLRAAINTASRCDIRIFVHELSNRASIARLPSGFKS